MQICYIYRALDTKKEKIEKKVLAIEIRENKSKDINREKRARPKIIAPTSAELRNYRLSLYARTISNSEQSEYLSLDTSYFETF